MKTRGLVALALSIALMGTVDAQYSLSIGSGEGAPGSDVSVSTTLDAAGGEAIQGWSYGVCGGAVVDVADGATTAGLLSGAGPDFNQINILPGGWTVGVVISFLGLETLAPADGSELNIPTYSAPAAGTSDAIDYCSTLGDPAVSTVVVVGGASIPPATSGGTITGLDIQPFIFSADSTTVEIGTASFAINASITDNLAGDQLTQGFSMGLGQDALVTATGIAAAPVLAELNGGAGPDFFGENILPGGWTVGVVYAFLGGVFLEFPTATPVIEASYDVTGAPADGDTSVLDWRDDLGDPPVSNVVVVGGQSLGTERVDGTVSFVAPPPLPVFLRGDANDDGLVNIADGVWIISELHLGGAAAPCAEARDANNDDLFDSSDAVYIFNYRFLGGAMPPAPFPDCGFGLETDDCASSSCP